MIQTEIVVIGSGPGGSITASLLAENGYNVILIDSGSNYRLNSCMPFTQEEMEQKYNSWYECTSAGSLNSLTLLQEEGAESINKYRLF